MITTFFILKFFCIILCFLIVFYNHNPVYSVLNLVTFFVIGSILLLILGVDFLPYVFIIIYAGAVAVLFLFIVIILKIKLGSIKTDYKKIFIITLVSIFLSSFTYSLPYLDGYSRQYSGRTFDEWDADWFGRIEFFWCDKYLNILREFTPKNLKGIRLCDSLPIGPFQKEFLICYSNFLTDFKVQAHHIQLGKQHGVLFLCTKHGKGSLYAIYPFYKRESYFSTEDFILYDQQSNLINLGKILYTEYYLHFILIGLILLVAIIGAISLTIKLQQKKGKQTIFIQITRSSRVGKTYI